MDENKNLEKDNEAKVVGGVILDDKRKTLIEECEIEKYEYKCNNCGKKFYENTSQSKSCPFCGSAFRFFPTGVMLVDYNYVYRANNRAAKDQDT